MPPHVEARHSSVRLLFIILHLAEILEASAPERHGDLAGPPVVADALHQGAEGGAPKLPIVPVP